MQMVSHGLIAGGLFLMVGMIYERCHTPRARRVRRPREAAARVLGVLHDPDAGVDRAADDERLHRRVPGAAGRVRCVVAGVPAGRRRIRWCWPSSAVAGVVLGALYMLWFAQRFLFGAAKAPHRRSRDLTSARSAILARHRRRGLRPRALSRRSRCARPSSRRGNTSSWSARATGAAVASGERIGPRDALPRRAAPTGGTR